MIQSQTDYYRHREEVERIAAKGAPSEAVRRVHEELAHHYAELIRREEPAAPDQPIVTLV